MNWLLRAIDRICLAGAVFAACAVSALALMLLAEVFFTSVVGWSQPWGVEWAAYLCAMTLFAGSGYALGQGSHIRVEIYTSVLPRRWTRWVDLGCCVFALGVAVMLAYGLIVLTLKSYTTNSVSYFAMKTPMAIPQGLVAASVCILVLGLAARALRLCLNQPPQQSTALLLGQGAAE